MNPRQKPGVFIVFSAAISGLFAPKKFNGNKTAADGNNNDDNCWKQQIINWELQRCRFEQFDTLCQRHDIRHSLHRFRHNLVRQGGPGEDQHGKVEDAGNDARSFGVRRNASNQDSNAEHREKHQQITAQEQGCGAMELKPEENFSREPEQH